MKASTFMLTAAAGLAFLVALMAAQLPAAAQEAPTPGQVTQDHLDYAIPGQVPPLEGDKAAADVQPAYAQWTLKLVWTQNNPQAAYMCVDKLALSWSAWRFLGCGGTGLGQRFIEFPGPGPRDAVLAPQVGDRYRITFYTAADRRTSLGTLELTAPDVPNGPLTRVLVPVVVAPLVTR